mgnify:CR=1 FL=1
MPRCLFATTVLLAPLLAGCVIDNPAPEDCTVETVTVADVREGPSFDVQIHPTDGGFRYVNRGLEKQPDLQSWEERLEGRRVTLHVVRRTRHVARITLGDGTIAYDELDRDRS